MGDLNYPSIEAFYEADDRRRHSGESDFGVWWWDGQPWRSSNYRVTAVEATGELYAVRLAARAAIAGDVFVAQAGAEHDVEVLAQLEPGYDQAEELLAGWADVCGGTASMGWIRDRVAGR